jgi:hypothetical protein
MKTEPKVFISLKVPRGDPELDQLATLTADLVHQAGMNPFVAPYAIAENGLVNPKDFMPFARQHALTSDLMIVYYHPELRGGLIEMGLAYANEIPIWLCYKMPGQGDKVGQKISSSALGCTDIKIEYDNLDTLNRKVTANLASFREKFEISGL